MYCCSLLSIFGTITRVLNCASTTGMAFALEHLFCIVVLPHGAGGHKNSPLFTFSSDAGKVVLKIIAFACVLSGLNVLYNVTFFEGFPHYKPAYFKIATNLRKYRCVLFWRVFPTFRGDDSVKTSISDLTALFYPGLRFVNVNKEATHAGVTVSGSRSLRGHDTLPKAVVITLICDRSCRMAPLKLETPFRNHW